MPNLTDVLNGEDTPTIEDIIQDNTVGTITEVNKLMTADDIGELGGGDMVKAIYDSDNSGIVDNTEKFGNVLPTGYVNTTAAQDINGNKTFTGNIFLLSTYPTLVFKPSPGYGALVKFNDENDAQMAYIGVLATNRKLVINNTAGDGINIRVTTPAEAMVNSSPIATTAAINTFTVAQRGTIQEIAYAANKNINLALSNRFNIDLAGNILMGLPTNIVAGQGGVIYIKQDATGGRTVSWDAPYKLTNLDDSSGDPLNIQIYAYEVYSASVIIVTYAGEVSTV